MAGTLECINYPKLVFRSDTCKNGYLLHYISQLMLIHASISCSIPSRKHDTFLGITALNASSARSALYSCQKLNEALRNITAIMDQPTMVRSIKNASAAPNHIISASAFTRLPENFFILFSFTAAFNRLGPNSSSLFSASRELSPSALQSSSTRISFELNET